MPNKPPPEGDNWRAASGRPASDRPTIVALMPLKAHSERVPGKNFRLLGDRPLFRWMLDSLLSVARIASVVINTDAREQLLANGLVEGERTVIRDRRSELCGDLVSMNLILADDLAAVPADVYLMTHVTNPLLSAATLERAITSFLEASAAGTADSLFSVTRYQSRFYDSEHRPVNHDPQNLIRTQDLPPLYEENSNLYLFTPDSFAATGARIGRRPMLFETPALESVDIDDRQDWRLATALVALGPDD